MALEEKEEVAANMQQPETLNDQLDETETTEPAQEEQEATEEKNDKTNEEDERQEEVEEDALGGAGKGEGKEGDPQNPSQTGTPPHTPHTETEPNAAEKKIRNDAAKAAKKASYNPTGIQNIYSWGNITHRPSTGTIPLGYVRVGDVGFMVHNPTKKFLDAPLGYPVLIDTRRVKKGPGGMGVPNNAVVLLEQKKMDMHSIEATRVAAGVYENTAANLAFDQNFSHIYYTSMSENYQRGRIIFDPDTKRLAIMIMEYTHKGKWVKAGLIQIRLDVVITTADLKLGTEVFFSTVVWGDAVFAYRIAPCALMTETETEYNTRAALPTFPSEFIAVLDTAKTKTIGTHNLKLLYRELGSDIERRVGEEKWGELEDQFKNPVDILITDNSEGTYPETTVVLKLTSLITNYQSAPTPKAPTPLCWDFLKTSLAPDQLTWFDKKVVGKGIGLAVVVEANETSQKIFLEWARSSISLAVAGRNIDTNRAFIDSIGVTCSFGTHVTATNFNELVSDSFYDPDKTVGLQAIKIFDKKVPAVVTFCPKNSEKVTIDTDLATRGLVVMSLEAVSKKVSEDDRLTIVGTGEATKAAAFYNNNREVQIKFRTTIENCKLFDKIKKEYKLQIYYDNNPASRYVGKKPRLGFRTIMCSTVGWSEDQYHALLSEVHSLKNTDFFVMKLGDMVGGTDGEWTRFTIGTEDFRTGKVLAALKLKLPLMQIMGINGFLTRIAVKGKVSFEAIEAAVLSINKILPNAIKLTVFNNKIKRYSKQELHKTWSSPQKFQPHYSQYVVALAGFLCPLDEAEVVGFLSLADVDVTGAAFTWYATESEDFVLQITTTKEDQILQLREREGGQHDITTFLKWTPKLFQSLRYVATLGQKLEIERDPSIVLPAVRSPLSDREIADIVHDGVTDVPAGDTVPPSDSKSDEEWSVVGQKGRGKKGKRSSSSNPSSGTLSAQNTAHHPSPSPSLSSSSSFSALGTVTEEEAGITEEEEDSKDDSKKLEADREEAKNPGNKKGKKGTTKQFSAINTDIIKKIRLANSEVKQAECSRYLEDKKLSFYELKYTAEQVYEEMERLLTLEGDDILREIMPDIQEEANSQKRSKREGSKRRRSTDATANSRPRQLQAEDAKFPSEDEELLSETEEHSGVPDPPAASLSQLSLHTMWDKTPPTSQEPNKKHNGGEK